jgi:hypothetical protein
MRRPGLTTIRAAPGRDVYSCEPTALGPDLSCWLRSTVGITLAVAKVSAWSDQSGKAANFSQGTDALRPDFIASDANFNGFPSVRFSTVDTRLLAALATVTIQHALIVANHPLALFAGNSSLIIAQATTMMGVTGANTWRTDVLPGATYRDGSPNRAALDAPNRPHIFECAWSAPTTAEAEWFLGGDNGGAGRQWGGSIVEVVTSSKLIPDRIARGLRQMLRTRYGTP